MWHDNAFTQRLKLRFPIVQGPFGGGLSSVDLLVAVSEAGGLGSFGVHHLSAEQITELAAHIRTRTSQPFALNLWVSNHDAGGLELSRAQFDAAVQRFQPYYDALGIVPPPIPAHYGKRFEDQIQAVLDARPAVFSFVFGIPSADVLAACRQRGIVTLGAVTTVQEAVAMEQAGVDMLVATGMEAGGHRVSFLQSAEQSLTGTFALVPAVADAVRIPVVAAGGIADGRGVAAALVLGAQGVQIGTAFLACDESNAAPVHREALFSEAVRSSVLTTALTRAFSGRLARGLRNRFVDEWAQRPADVLPYPIQNWFTGSFRQAAMAQGRSEMMSLWAGQAAPLLRHRSARVLFDQLVQDTHARLQGLGTA